MTNNEKIEEIKPLDEVSRMIKQHPGLQKEDFVIFRLLVDGKFNTTTRVIKVQEVIQTARKETAKDILYKCFETDTGQEPLYYAMSNENYQELRKKYRIEEN